MTDQQMLQEGIENIRNTDSIKRLEEVSTMILTGLVIDKSHEQEYITLFQECQDRLKVLCIISGEDHPLLQVDVINEREKVERSMMMSMLITTLEMEVEELTKVHQPSFSLN